MRIVSLVLAIVVVALAAVVVGQVLMSRHTTLAALGERVPEEQAEAARRLFQNAGIGPREVLVADLDRPDDPCWVVRWTRLDRALGTSRRFGPYASGLRCVGVYGGEVVGVSLVGAPLSDTGPLTWLHGLRTLRLHSSGLEALPHLPSPCRLTHLDLAENRLVHLDDLPACPHLRRLDLARNHLVRLPALDRLPALERLDATANRITSVAPLATHPALEQVFLSSNDLTSVEGLRDLPHLGLLDLGSNPLAELGGLGELPALRSLRVAATQLTRLPADLLQRLPLIEHITLSGAPFQELPEGFAYEGGGQRDVRLSPSGERTAPMLDVTGTPLGDRLRTGALASHDGTATYHAERLPRGSGRSQGSRRRARTGTGLGTHLSADGTMEWLVGAQSIAFDVDRGLTVTVEASVDAGRLRMYVKDEHGYRYAEAVPGRPLRISGRLITGTDSYVVFVEAVEGRAEGIVWRVSG